MKLFILLIVISSFENVFLTKVSNCMSGQHCSYCDGSTGHCTTECQPGFYGPRCNIRCSYGCKERVCVLHEDGTEKCLTGCKPGFYGVRCSIPCSKNEQCLKCPNECEGGFCQLASRCVSGCEDSYFGTNCTGCGPDCGVCDRKNGICLEKNSSNERGEASTDIKLSAFNLSLLIAGAGISVLVVISLVVFIKRRKTNIQRTGLGLGQIGQLDGTGQFVESGESGTVRYINADDGHYDSLQYEACF